MALGVAVRCSPGYSGIPWPQIPTFERVVARARKLAADAERDQVASEVRKLVARSGLSRQAFADRIGTSRSQLSTYMAGKVVPSAALMVRMRRVERLACGQALGETRTLPSRRQLAEMDGPQ